VNDKEILDLLTLDDLNDKNRELAGANGMDAFRKLLLWGDGTGATYIPKIDRVVIPVRDELIRREFNGYNVYELAKRWDRTDSTIRRIVREKASQLREERRRQLRAPSAKQISFEDIQNESLRKTLRNTSVERDIKDKV